MEESAFILLALVCSFWALLLSGILIVMKMATKGIRYEEE